MNLAADCYLGPVTFARGTGITVGLASRPAGVLGQSLPRVRLNICFRVTRATSDMWASSRVAAHHQFHMTLRLMLMTAEPRSK